MNIVLQITEKDLQKGAWVQAEVLRLAERLSMAEPSEPKEPKTPKEKQAEPESPATGDGDAPEIDESLRVEVRKTLAQLNKKAGKNIASDLIKGFGADKLTEVALSDLPALWDKAKEALENAG